MPTHHCVAISQTDIEVDDLPFVVARKVLTTEPSENWDDVEYVASSRAGASGVEDDPEKVRKAVGASFKAATRQSFLGSSIRNSIHALGIDLIQHTEKPSHIHSIYDTELNLVRLFANIGYPGFICMRNTAVAHEKGSSFYTSDR